MGRFNASYRGIGEMLTADFMQADMLRRAEKIKEAAEALAPYDPNDKDGVHYRDSFEADVYIRETPTRRAVGRVVNTDPHAVHIEFGTSDTPAHHTLLRALDAAKD